MARSARARGAFGFHLLMVWANARRCNRLRRFVTQLLQGGRVLCGIADFGPRICHESGVLGGFGCGFSERANRGLQNAWSGDSKLPRLYFSACKTAQNFDEAATAMTPSDASLPAKPPRTSMRLRGYSHVLRSLGISVPCGVHSAGHRAEALFAVSLRARVFTS